ncbi:Flavin-containing amine oxidase [Lasiodiplodia theobromae]|uniref:Flavin-containing amine oxidase n=1 Tax=Lasiodiplodia theobromae TaxID=45133 RepID=UPI0015C3A28F|nr:Flavin-containing amine oxidase [Lasiodiplodia theobromae]KAF4544892.1 Flavin-containing amine oxidase [Lasiodiplodia theobromae]
MAAETADVIVIGAGLSGLTAAREIQRAGYSCIVLEAEDRVGGMLLSVDQYPGSTDSKVAIDVGAAWLNNTTQSAIWGLLTPDELKAMASFYAHLGATVSSIDPAKPWTHPSAAELDSITLAQFCAQHASSSAPLIPLLLNASVRYLLGAEADEVSALWFLAFCAAGTGLQNMMAARAGGGQHLRIREGTQRIATSLAAELTPGTVRLSSPVASIDQSTTSSTSVTVTTTSGHSFRGARAVLAVPTPQHRSLSFTPALPPAKQRLADSAHMGCFGKATLVYDRPWWRDDASAAVGPLNAIFESILGPVIYSRSTSVPSTNHWSITGSIVGAPGRRWAALPTAEERKKAVVEQLRHGFGAVMAGGEKAVPEPVAYVEGEWVGRKYFGGGPVPVMGPGVLTEVRGALTETFGRVHFVGAETAEVWRGYMEGAVRSGLRGAEEVVGELRKEGHQQAGKL